MPRWLCRDRLLNYSTRQQISTLIYILSIFIVINIPIFSLFPIHFINPVLLWKYIDTFVGHVLYLKHEK